LENNHKAVLKKIKKYIKTTKQFYDNIAQEEEINNDGDSGDDA
jgi:hypothetical protein